MSQGGTGYLGLGGTVDRDKPKAHIGGPSTPIAPNLKHLTTRTVK